MSNSFNSQAALEETHTPSTSASSVQMINFGEFDVSQKESSNSGVPIVKNMNPIDAVKAKLQVYVGEIEITVGELMSAKEHQVLAMKNSISEPVNLMLEGQIIARGQLVAVDGYFAVRITDLPLSLKS